MKTVTLVKKVEAPTIDELITRYELANHADGKSPHTISWYDDMLKSFSKYRRANKQSLNITDFRIDTVRDYILYLRTKLKFDGHPYTPKQDVLLSPKTVQCHTRVLKAFASWLNNEGYTAGNVLEKLKLPKAPATIVEPLSEAEIKVVIKCIDKKTPTGMRNKAILLLKLDSGFRASELVDIRVGHLNLDEGYAKVMGKGAKERIVPLGKVVQKELWRYVDTVRPKSAAGCDNLFLSGDGHPITANTVKMMFARLAKASGVAKLHAHLCRHTFAINYLLNGGDIFSLQAILGHTTLEMVRHYLHFTSSQITAQHHKYSPMDRLHSE